MGMFDYVQCDYPLPDGFKPKGSSRDFQTKAFDRPFMEPYTITAEGRLLKEDGEYETTPEKERPYYGKPGFEGLMKFCGSIRKVNKRIVDTEYHGDFNFYDWDDELKLMRDYTARFTNGQLEWIRGGLEKAEQNA